MPIINDHIQIASSFSRYDCYESFTKPKLFLKLFFYTPSGPEYIYVILLSEFEYLNRNNVFMNETYHFKRIKEYCVSNFTLTMNQKKFLRMHISIKIHLSTFPIPMSIIIYTFEYGFTLNEHLFIDIYGNFGVNVRIKNIRNEFISNIFNDSYATNIYLDSLKNNKGHLCVITENNRDIIIQPYYGIFKPNGYIIGIQIVLKSYNKFILAYELETFECDVEKNFINTQTAIITEEIPESYLKFKAYYVNFNKGNEKRILSVPFTPLGINRYNFNESFIYRKPFRIIFLMKSNSKSIHFIKGFYVKPYEIKYNFDYYINKVAELQIEPKVIQKRLYKYSPFCACI